MAENWPLYFRYHIWWEYDCPSMSWKLFSLSGEEIKGSIYKKEMTVLDCLALKGQLLEHLHSCQMGNPPAIGKIIFARAPARDPQFLHVQENVREPITVTRVLPSALLGHGKMDTLDMLVTSPWAATASQAVNAISEVRGYMSRNRVSSSTHSASTVFYTVILGRLQERDRISLWEFAPDPKGGIRMRRAHLEPKIKNHFVNREILGSLRAKTSTDGIGIWHHIGLVG